MNPADDLAAERFGRSLWWTKKPEPLPVHGDHDLICAKRRRDATAEVYPHGERGEQVAS